METLQGRNLSDNEAIGIQSTRYEKKSEDRVQGKSWHEIS